MNKTKKYEQWKLDGKDRIKLIKIVQINEIHAQDLNAQKTNTKIEYVEVDSSDHKSEQYQRYRTVKGEKIKESIERIPDVSADRINKDSSPYSYEKIEAKPKGRPKKVETKTEE